MQKQIIIGMKLLIYILSYLSDIMKIIMTNYMETTYPGGINKLIMEISSFLSEQGHEIMIIQPNPYGLPNEEINNKIKIIRVNKWFNDLYGFNLNVYFHMKKYLNDFNADIVHIHGYQTFFSLIIFKSILKNDKKIPIIFSPHFDIYRSTFAGKYFFNIYDYFSKIIFKKSDYIITCSNFEKNTIINNYNIDGNISIIPHGVEFIYNDEKNFFNNRSLNLLYSGHLVERKGVDNILYSLKYLVYDLNFNNVKLTVIGEGPEKSKLFRLSKDLELNNYVIWKPFLPRNELIKEIRNTNIFMLLSNSEAYGISVAESLALGRPCIVTDRTALSEFLDEPGCYGVNFPPDPKEVANLIIDIYKNNPNVGPFNKIRTWKEVANDYENIYLQLI